MKQDTFLRLHNVQIFPETSQHSRSHRTLSWDFTMWRSQESVLCDLLHCEVSGKCLLMWSLRKVCYIVKSQESVCYIVKSQESVLCDLLHCEVSGKCPVWSATLWSLRKVSLTVMSAMLWSLRKVSATLWSSGKCPVWSATLWSLRKMSCVICYIVKSQESVCYVVKSQRKHSVCYETSQCSLTGLSCYIVKSQTSNVLCDLLCCEVSGKVSQCICYIVKSQ